MIGQPPYYIYLDTQIIGCGEQICTLFDQGVFERDTVVLFKIQRTLRTLSNKIKILWLLKQHGIRYRLIFYIDEIDSIMEGTIFYPFNAASNTRVVANRSVRHIFVTHGESNKICSVKPIIRIYDTICVAGQAGIDRYLLTQIFRADDVKNGRIQKVGGAFLGKTGLSPTGSPVIFYAPTWEGQAESENYCSLFDAETVVESIFQAACTHEIKTILIKPHPNIGHRKSATINALISLIDALKNKGLDVLLTGNHALNFYQTWKLKKATPYVAIGDYSAVLGFCDISAMETLLLNENIPYYLFSAEKHTGVQCLNFTQADNPYGRYYQNAKIVLGKTTELKPIRQNDFIQLKNYVIHSL